MSQNVDNLAEVVLITAKRCPYAFSRAALQPIAAALPFTKRMSYNEHLLDLVERSKSIETEEILGQITPDFLPFDRLWLAGPFPTLCNLQREPETGSRLGMLVSAEKGKGQFSFKLCASVDTQLIQKMAGAFHVNKPLFSVNGHSITYAQDITTVVCSEKGIVLDEQAILKSIEESQKRLTKFSTVESKKIKFEEEYMIDIFYGAADFLSRAFLILGSEAVKHDIEWKRTAKNIEDDKRLRDRLRMNGAPRATEDPIIIDLAKVHPKLTEESGPVTVRELLGITSVRRSKPIVSKHGKVFTRKPHERRIAAPVDRRDVERQLTVSQPVALEIGPQGPIRRLGQAKLG